MTAAEWPHRQPVSYAVVKIHETLVATRDELAETAQSGFDNGVALLKSVSTLSLSPAELDAVKQITQWHLDIVGPLASIIGKALAIDPIS